MFMIDTNICIYLIKNKYEYLHKKVEEEGPYRITVSSITVAELEFGIAKSQFPEKNRVALLEFLAPFEIIPFTEFDCEYFGGLRAYLNKKGTPIGPYDLQIAAQCLARDLILVSNNIKEFERVPELKYENWVKNN